MKLTPEQVSGLKTIIDYSAKALPQNYMAHGWKPHGWITMAVEDAFLLGVKEGKAKAQTEADFIQQQSDQHYREARTSEMRATVAAVLETFTVDKEGEKTESLSTFIKFEKMATVWDRWEYFTTTSEDGKSVQITIVRKD